MCTAHQRQRQGCPFLCSEPVSREVGTCACCLHAELWYSGSGQPGKYSKSPFKEGETGKREGGEEGNAQRDIL